MTSKAFNRQERHGAPETSRPQPPQPPNLVFIEREEDTIYEPSVEDKQKSTIDPPQRGATNSGSQNPPIRENDGALWRDCLGIYLDGLGGFRWLVLFVNSS